MHRQSWAWGEFPTTPIGSPLGEKESQEKEQHDSMLTTMFSFMKQGKHRRPNTEGVYLADISSGAIDPEVAALYFTGSNQKKNTGEFLFLFIGVFGCGLQLFLHLVCGTFIIMKR